MRRKDILVKDIKELEKILSICKTCHIAMVDEGMPYVLPLSYGYEITDNQIILYFHSAYEGRKIDVLRKNNNVCFAISNEGEAVRPDTPCNSGYYFSSVIGNGKVYFIDDTSEKCRALSFMFKNQTGKYVEFAKEQTDTVCVFKIISSDFTGKRKEKM